MDLSDRAQVEACLTIAFAMFGPEPSVKALDNEPGPQQRNLVRAEVKFDYGKVMARKAMALLDAVPDKEEDK